VQVISLRNMIESPKGDLAIVEAQVKAGLGAGASVEPGVHRVILKDASGEASLGVMSLCA
jgi:hypothetical protein